MARYFAQFAWLLSIVAGCARRIALWTSLTVAGTTLCAQDQPPELESIYKRGLQLYQAGKYADAIPVVEEYIAVAAAKFGEGHPLYAGGLGALGILYHALDRTGEAEPLLKRALTIKEKALGPDHAEVADALHDLAEFYRKYGRLAEADPLYQRALSIAERALGPEHAATGIVLGNLAELYRAQGRRAEAEPLAKRSLAIREKLPSVSQNSQTEQSGDLLARVKELNQAGKYAEAIPIAERYIEVIEARHGMGSPEYAVALNNLAQLLQATNRLAEAEPLMRRALAIDEEAVGPEHPEVAVKLGNLALFLMKTNRPSEAEALLRRALVINEKYLGPAHPSVANALHNLAGLLKDTNRFGEAEPLTRRALAIFEESFGVDHPNVAKSLDNLAELLRVTNRLTEAEPLYRRALTINEKSLGPEHPAVGIVLNNIAQLLQATNRLAEAEQLMRRALAIDEQSLGPEHPSVAVCLNNLARLLQDTNRLAEAEPLMRRALAIGEKSFGPEHPDVALKLNNLAGLLIDSNRFIEAEPLMRRALAIREKTLGPEHPDVSNSLNSLAILLEEGSARYEDSEKLKRRALAIDEKSFGPDHPTVATKLNNLAALLQKTNRLAEAEPLYRRALAINEKSFGGQHPAVARDVNNLGQLLQATNRLIEAEPLMRRALAIDENSFGPQHPNVAIRLNNLALLLEASIRPTEAEPLVRRAIAIFEKALGTDHPNVATAVSNLANLLQATDRSVDAEPLMRRAIAIFENSLGADHPNVATAVNNLAMLLLATNRLADAEPLMRRAIAIDESHLGPDHPNVARSRNNLALVLHATNRPEEAEGELRRALAIDEKSLGSLHPNVARELGNLALLLQERGDWIGSLAFHKRAKPILARRRNEESNDRNGLGTAVVSSNTWNFRAHARAIYHAGGDTTASREEGFELAQWALQTSAAQALFQMAARSAKTSSPLAQLVREQQDIAARRAAADKQLLAALGHSDAPAAANARKSLASLDTALDVLDARLSSEYKEYAELVDPKPLTIAAAQALLRDGEALVLFLDVPKIRNLPGETLVWVVGKAHANWARIKLASEVLAERTAELRCGLDRGAWEGEGMHRCLNLLAVEKAPEEDKPLPFDLTRAHQLYQVLFGQVEEFIKGKHLLIVPSGPLTQIPFHVLVTEQPDLAATGAETFRRAAWLARSTSITVLPSVSSLKALREHAKTSHATKPFVGFGNPLLDGPDHRYGVRAELARAKQQCAKAPAQRVAGPVAGGMKQLRQRAGLAEVADIRSQVPLPETADELCTVARDLGVSDSDIWLGARANEREVKRLSEIGQLASYRIVHFATHGALAGELKAGAEPGLILTPPGEAIPEDDGYLSASEIAGLKLDADWVILSACNTGAGGAEGAEALSGMSGAFFYAGARALLVSHWAVNSDATVKLITKTLSTMAADKTVSRSEALRQSMVALIEHGELQEAHPAYWAPFVVVGEGSTGEATSSVARTPAVPVLMPPAQKKTASPKSQPKGREPWTVEIWRKQAN